MELVYKRTGILFKILPCLLVVMVLIMCLVSPVFATSNTTTFDTGVTYSSDSDDTVKFNFVDDVGIYKYVVAMYRYYQASSSSAYKYVYLFYSDKPFTFSYSYISSTNISYTATGTDENQTIYWHSCRIDSCISSGSDYSFVVSENIDSSNSSTGQVHSSYGGTNYNFNFIGSSYDLENFNLYTDRGTSGNSQGDGNEPTTGDSGDTTNSDDSSGWFASILQGIQSIGEFFTSLLSYVSPFSDNFILKDLISFISPSSDNFMLSSVLDYLNPFSENFILSDLWGFLGNIISYINPSSENFLLKDLWNHLSNIISYINPFSENFLGNKIVNLFSDLLKTLFVPKNESFTQFKELSDSKFGFVDSIETAIDSIKNIINNVGQAPKLIMSFDNKYIQGDVAIIDFSWYAPYKQYGDLVLTGFIYAFFIWRLFITLPNTINAVGGASSNISSTIQKFSGGDKQ